MWLPFCVCPTEWSKWWGKDLFFDQLHALTARIPGSKILIPYGDWNGHLGCVGTGTGKCMVAWGMAGWNQMLRVREPKSMPWHSTCFLGTCFKKFDSHLITYKSGNVAMQIDFILFCRTMHKLVTDVKVIPGEEVALQHLLVCDMRIDVPLKSKPVHPSP